jgi:hypothetical protein
MIQFCKACVHSEFYYDTQAPLFDWFELCEAHQDLADACGFPVREPVPPAPLDMEFVARLAATLRDPVRGGILRDALAGVLAQLIGDAIAAAVEGTEAPHGGSAA